MSSRPLTRDAVLLAVRRLVEFGMGNDTGRVDYGNRALGQLQRVHMALPENDEDEDGPAANGHALLLAAEVLVDAADSVTADLRGDEGDILCRMDWPTLHGLIDNDGSTT